MFRKLFRDPEERIYCFADGDDPAAPPAGGGGDPSAADPPADPGATPPVAAGDDGVAAPATDKTQKDWRDRQINRQHGKIKNLETELAEARAESARLRELAEAGGRRAAAPAAGEEPSPAAPPAAARREPARPVGADPNVKAQARFEVQVEAMDAALREHYADALPNVLQNLALLDEGERAAIVAAAVDTDDPAYVMSVVGKDPERLQQLAEMPQSRRQAELIKVSLGKAAPKTPPKKPSGAPEPPNNDRAPAGGAAAASTDLYNEKISDDDWYRTRMAQKRESKGRPWSVGGAVGR